MDRAWVGWSLLLLVASLIQVETRSVPPAGLLMHVKGQGVQRVLSSAPIAPMQRDRNSVHHLAMGRAISINQATEEQLQTVPHIGPVRAAEIVKNRRDNGAFLRVGDLRRVHGIGPQTIRKVAPYLTF